VAVVIAVAVAVVKQKSQSGNLFIYLRISQLSKMQIEEN